MIWTGYANYQQKIAQDGRQQTVEAKVTLRDGFKYVFKNADIMESGLSFSDGTSEAGKLTVGSFIGKCLTLKLYNYDGHLVETQFDAALIDMSIGLVVDASTTEWVPLGTFGVGEHAESGGIITLTAYDDSVKFDKKYDSTLSYPASLLDIVKDACAKCGVDWSSTNFANMNYTVNKRPNDDSITYADIVSYAAQLAGCWARINTSRQLIFGWYDMDRFYPDTGDVLDGGTFSSTPTDTVDGGNFTNYNIDTVFGGVFRQNLDAPAEIASLSSCTMPTEDIRVTGVKLVPTDSKKSTLIKGTDDYAVTIDKNPLAQEYLGSLLTNIAKRLIDLQFRPMEVSAWDNPSIEAGDVAYLTDPKGNRYRTIISNIDYEFGDYEKFSADAKSKADMEAERYSTSEKAASALNMRKSSDYITTGQISGDTATAYVNDLQKNYIATDYENMKKMASRVDAMSSSRQSGIGAYATAQGLNTSPSGIAATAEGYLTCAPGEYSHSEGHGSTSSGKNSHAENMSFAPGDNAHSEGGGIAKGAFSHAEGVSEAGIPEYGHSSWQYNRYVGEDFFYRECPIAAGIGSHVEGTRNLAEGNFSHAEGSENICKGNFFAHVEGLRNLADSAGGYGTHAEGYQNIAKGYAHAQGINNLADGAGSTVCGRSNEAHGKNEVVIGCCNKVDDDDANGREANYFIIGNGETSSYAAERERWSPSNAFRVTRGGQVYGVGAYNSSGADYSEYFEWADENPNKEDRVGRFVTLDGAKIQFAKPGDDVLGIISGCPSVIGDAASENWSGRYMTDVFGRPILETVNIPEMQEKDKSGKVIRTIPAHTETRWKVNPDYDPAKEMEYIPREKRPEWSAVGMMGKIVLIDDGSCKPGGYCEPAADGTGIATAAAKRNNCRIMERLDDTHIRVCLK